MHTKRRFSLLLATTAAIALGIGGLALAAGPGKHGRHDAREMLRAADTDNSGSVSRAEFDAARAARQGAVDANRDGAISFEEMKAHREAMREQRERERFARLDSDGDGRVSVEEFEARGDLAFDRLDANGDGEISPDDRGERRRMMRERMRG